MFVISKQFLNTISNVVLTNRLHKQLLKLKTIIKGELKNMHGFNTKYMAIK